MKNDIDLALIAESLILVRSARHREFPSEIFDEHAWNMLLVLFVAHADSAPLGKNELFKKAGASPLVAERWLRHLVKDGQVSAPDDDDSVSLTHLGLERFRRFLAEAHRIHAAPESH